MLSGVQWPCASDHPSAQLHQPLHDGQHREGRRTDPGAMSAADRSRVLARERSLGPELLRGERPLTVDHVRVLARRFNVEPGTLL